MHNIKKRLVALLMTLVMALSLSATAFAAEPTNIITEDSAASVSEEASTRASLGDVIAFGATTIYGGSGVLYVTLPSGNFWADIVAGIGYTSESGAIAVSVTTPDGDVIDLSTLSGSGSYTRPYELIYAPSGTYAFYFLSTISSPIEVVAYIYD